MRLKHPVFQGPLVPNLDLCEIDTPENYRGWPEGKNLPKKLDAWRVQAGQLSKDLDYGLVSDPYGFEDSPDAEWISSGRNSKGPTSAALARHGNYFLWGFSGDPVQMTESGRRVFLNAVCYMKRFDGQRPLVSRMQSGRDSAFVYVGYLRKYAAAAGGNEWLKRVFSPKVREDSGLDADKLEKLFTENLEFVYWGKEGLAVDEDLKKLGVSNRRHVFFDAMLARMDRDPKDPIARRLLDRYVGRAEAETPAGLRGWLEANRDHLFFSDVGGYRWFVDEHAKSRTREPDKDRR